MEKRYEDIIESLHPLFNAQNSVRKLDNCTIQYIEQCERALAFYRWLHDQLKPCARTDEKNQNENIELNFGAYANKLVISYGIHLERMGLQLSPIILTFLGINDSANQYLYAQMLDYFVRQNFDDIGKLNKSKIGDFLNPPYIVKPRVSGSPRCAIITEDIMYAIKRGNPSPSIIEETRKKVKTMGPGTDTSRFGTVMDDIERIQRTIK